MDANVKKLFAGLSFVLREPNKEVQGLLENHGGRLLKVNDNAISTIVLIEEGSPGKLRRKRNAEDEDDFGEGQWKVFTRWVQECVLSGQLIDFGVNGEDTYLVVPPPQGVPNPLLPLFGNEFTVEDDEALKMYGLQCRNKGFKLESNMTVWEHITKQTKNRLSRFSAQQLRDRFISFGNPSPKQKQSREAKGTVQDNSPPLKDKLRSASKLRQRLLQEIDDEEEAIEMILPKKKMRPAKEEEEEADDENAMGNKKRRLGSAATTTAGSSVRGTVSKGLSPMRQKHPSQVVPASQASVDSDAQRTDTKYSKEESAKMVEFATENPTLSQTEMWTKAYNEGLLPGRSILSMKKHYRILDEKLNRTQPVVSSRRNFSYEEDQVLFQWIYQWMAEHGKDGIWGRRMWEGAEAQRILPDRTAEMMHNRFHNALRKRLEEGLEAAKASDLEFSWSVPRSPKKASKISSKNSPLSLVRGGDESTNKTAAPAPSTVYEYLRRPDELKVAVEVIDRVRGQAPNKPLDEVVRALYFTCCNERAAVRLLNGDDLDSKYDVWTPEEDRKLKEGQTIDRPDVHRRRVFLGLESRTGY